MRSFCHNVAVVPQPLPKRNPGGDCFACAVTAAMRHFFGEAAPTFDQCWEAFQATQTNSDGTTRTYLTNTFDGMRSALYNLSGNTDDKYPRPWPIVIESDIVVPLIGERWRGGYNWGWPVDGQAWAQRLDGWLRAGHLALGDLMYRPCPTGEWTTDADGKATRNNNDHFVLYDGVRSGWRAHETIEGAAALVYQVHVVCSANGGRAYWIDVTELLRQHGASAAWWLIRPDDRSGPASQRYDLPQGPTEETWPCAAPDVAR